MVSFNMSGIHGDMLKDICLLRLSYAMRSPSAIVSPQMPSSDGTVGVKCVSRLVATEESIEVQVPCS